MMQYFNLLFFNLLSIRADNGSVDHGSWVMGQMGQQILVGHVGHGY